jgi:hypothetical protein
MRRVKVTFKTTLTSSEISNLLDRFCMKDLDDLGNETCDWEITN